MTPILQPKARPGERVFTRTDWMSMPQPAPSPWLWWLKIAASCAGAFALGWLVQAFLVPVVLGPARVAAISAPNPPPVTAPEPAIPPEPPPPVEAAPEVVEAPATAPKPAEPKPVVVAAPVPAAVAPVAAATRPADFSNRARVRFVARLGEASALAPGLTLQVSQILASGRFDGLLGVDGKSRALRNQAALETIAVDAGRDLIVTAVSTEAVTGYVILPRQ